MGALSSQLPVAEDGHRYACQAAHFVFGVTKINNFC